MLQRLTRRQVEALQAVEASETPQRGASLNAIAAALHVTPPSALGHLTPLERMGLVARYRGKSRVSAQGRQTLTEYRRHHRVAESLFSGLGLAPKEICAAAREVDLSLSHRMVQRICEGAGHPETCPHGLPIPPCSARASKG